MITNVNSNQFNGELNDSAFTAVFRMPKYQKELLEIIEPELGEVDVQKIEAITLENDFTNLMYNDLGIFYQNRIFIFVEALNISSDSIPLTMLFHATKAIEYYLNSRKNTFYNPSQFSIPVIEFYGICVEKPVISPLVLSQSFGDKTKLDVSVNMIYDASKNNVLGQYFQFFRRKEEMRIERPFMGIEEYLQLCIDENILKEFILEHRNKAYAYFDILSKEYNERMYQQLKQKEDEQRKIEDEKRRVEDEKRKEFDQQLLRRKQELDEREKQLLEREKAIFEKENS